MFYLHNCNLRSFSEEYQNFELKKKIKNYASYKKKNMNHFLYLYGTKFMSPKSNTETFF